MYNIGSAVHVACLLLHFQPLLSAPALSTPAFSTPAFLTVSRCPLPHFQSPRIKMTLSTGGDNWRRIHGR